MVLDTYYDERFSAGPVIRWEAVNRAAARASIDFDVRTDSVFNAVGNLSGGNQQKVIIAREMSRDTQLLIAAQPTRGIDARARQDERDESRQLSGMARTASACAHGRSPRSLRTVTSASSLCCMASISAEVARSRC